MSNQKQSTKSPSITEYAVLFPMGILFFQQGAEPNVYFRNAFVVCVFMGYLLRGLSKDRWEALRSRKALLQTASKILLSSAVPFAAIYFLAQINTFGWTQVFSFYTGNSSGVLMAVCVAVILMDLTANFRESEEVPSIIRRSATAALTGALIVLCLLFVWQAWQVGDLSVAVAPILILAILAFVALLTYAPIWIKRMKRAVTDKTS